MFSCHLCDYQCKQKGNLKQHKRNKHDIDIIWHKCDSCDYICKQSSALKKHKQYIHDIDVKWIKCDLCDYQCKEKYKLKVHNQNKHGIIFKLPNIVSCDLCNYQCESTNLKRHKQYKHNIDVKWIKCDLCDYQCKGNYSLKVHKQNKHNIDVKWYNCTLCGYKCKQKQSLKTHEQNKHDCDKKVDIFNWKYKKKYKYEKSKYCFIGEKGSYQRLALAISQDLRFQKSHALILSDDIVELIAEKMKNIRCNNNNNKGILKFFNTAIIN